MNRNIRFFASLGWAGDTREEFYDGWVSSYLDSGWHEADQ